MNSKMRSLIALFMVIAVVGVYSFGLQTMRGYAGEEATGQTTGSQSEQDVDAEQDAPSSVAEKTDDGTEAGGSAKAAKGAGEDGESITAAGEEGESLDGAGEDAGEPEDEEIDMTDAVETGDFKVLGDEGKYAFDPDTGVLTITGDVVVSMKDGVTSTNQRIVVADDATVTIQDISIQAEGAPAIKINAPVSAELVLKGDNKVLGGNGNNVNHISGSYAGIEIEWESHENMASLTISGSGKIEAVGGPNSAAIGGSKSHNGVYGNITIESGTVVAKSGETDEWAGGAGIGSSDNPNNGTSSGSYKHTNDSWGVITINGGNITAVGGYNAAGIGGGNHCDSGKIVINGGTIDAKGHTGIGSGYGSSQTTSRTNLTKGPGYYYADITITGGDITAEAYSTGSTNDGGSGIGGGMYSDAKITITGGNITAKGGNGKNTDTEVKSYHHGGSGIGGGYEGHAEITITGGTITAIGGGASAGIGSGSIPNSNPSNTGSQGYKSRLGETTCEYTDIEIGGDVKITATGGSSGGAGIGGGVGADKVAISITGGNITAIGGKGSADKLDYLENGSPYAGGNGGAGIGSGYSGTTSGEGAKYFTTTDSLEISITGGEKVLAVGGWGASGIGSGADNTTATSITINAKEANIEAYADGTKFAIDTRVLSEDGTSTTSYTTNRDVTDGYILQGTFVHHYGAAQDSDIDQNAEALKSIIVTNDESGWTKELTGMKDLKDGNDGYRSYATSVASAGVYTVYTDAEEIGEGGGRYFSQLTTDIYDKEEAKAKGKTVQYTVEEGTISDNYYLFPVKTVVVKKTVSAENEGTDLSGLNTTAYFALFVEKNKSQSSGEDYYLTESGETDNSNPSAKIWTQSIDIVNGVPKNKAYFINVDDITFDVKEIDKDGYTTGEINQKEHVNQADYEEHRFDTSPQGSIFNGYILKRIETAHGDGSNNNAEISQDQWSDEIEFINTYEKKAAELVITKELPQFIDHKNGNETMGDVNATFFFEITGKYDGGNKSYQNTVGIDFNRNSDKVQTVTVALPSDITDLEVKEVYAGNYKLDPEQDPPEVVQNEDGVYTVKFKNVVSDYEYKGGITNKYELDGGISKLIGTTTNPQQP
ncbi:MAG: hypothetical protein IJH22_02855 [Firmicutes bacterium]|nr:hypothetical protein [Bacillota bacterium]